MADPKVRFEEMMTILKEHQFRLTPQRVELIRLISISEGHPSATQFYEQIQTKFPTMSHATVYKTLTLLKELGQVYEIDLRDDSHYDGNRPHPHPHLICMNCGRIMDGDISLSSESLTRLETTSGYRILHPQISLYGLCPRCQKDE